MPLTRRGFLGRLGLACGAGLLHLTGLGLLLQGCARNGDPPPPEAPAQKPEPWQPAYARLEDQGLLEERIQQAQEHMRECDLCPRRCGVDRLAGEQGFCRAPGKVMVYSYFPHFGEELPLVGRKGSGTIFFSNCNLRCVFCQNWPLAHEGRGQEYTDQELAEMMLHLERMGCHNINLVTPTHVMPHILNATRIALQEGLSLPLCYNTSGYERPEIIKLLDGIVDIYLPDLKFMDGEKASQFNLARACDYPDYTKRAILEMHRQVGDLVTDRQGLALTGLLVRHLVMPNRVAGTKEFVDWVAQHLSPRTYVNIMSQYRVEFMAFEYEEIARGITPEEYVEAMEWAQEAGLTNLDERSLAQLEVNRRKMGR